jgi:hypothetical protein
MASVSLSFAPVVSHVTRSRWLSTTLSCYPRPILSVFFPGELQWRSAYSRKLFSLLFLSSSSFSALFRSPLSAFQICSYVLKFCLHLFQANSDGGSSILLISILNTSHCTLHSTPLDLTRLSSLVISSLFSCSIFRRPNLSSFSSRKHDDPHDEPSSIPLSLLSRKMREMFVSFSTVLKTRQCCVTRFRQALASDSSGCQGAASSQVLQLGIRERLKFKAGFGGGSVYDVLSTDFPDDFTTASDQFGQLCDVSPWCADVKRKDKVAGDVMQARALPRRRT